ncbi:MAG: tetratricopeptide repeat protein [Bdellovibrionales bacterium]|nr:tetratricopeptide repeat protein [Bdellovibrionales bacterium]
MRKYVFISLILFLTACSTSSKKGGTSNVSQDQNDISSESLIEDSSAEKSGKTSEKNKIQATQRDNLKSEKNTSDPSNLYSQLNTFIKQQNEVAILDEGSKILMKKPNDTKALNAMAMVYYKRAQYGLAKDLLYKAIKFQPTYEVYSNLGIVYLATKEQTEALQSFKKAIELNPDDNVSATNAGSIYIKEHDYDKAVVALEIPYKKGIRDYRILNNYAVALTAQGKYEQAESVYKEALKQSSNSRELLLNYSILLIDQLKRYQDGLDIIQKLKFIGLPDGARSKVQELEYIARKERK